MINNNRPAVDRADHLGRRHGPVPRGPDAPEVVLAEQVRQHRLLRRRPLRVAVDGVVRLEVVEHERREGRGEHQRVLPVEPAHVGVRQARHLPDRVGELAPDAARVVEARVGRVGAEHEEQAHHRARQRVRRGGHQRGGRPDLRHPEVENVDEEGEEHVGGEAEGHAVEHRGGEEVEDVGEPVPSRVARRLGDVRVGGELRAPRVEAREGPARCAPLQRAEIGQRDELLVARRRNEALSVWLMHTADERVTQELPKGGSGTHTTGETYPLPSPGFLAACKSARCGAIVRGTDLVLSSALSRSYLALAK